MRVDHVVTSGLFHLGDESFEVDNNVWIAGDDHEVVVFDAPHDVEAILKGVDGRDVALIACTHADNDHINVVVEVAEATGADIALHPDDRFLWDRVIGDRPPDRDLHEGDVLEICGARLYVIHTPGHTPGHVSFYCPDGHVFSGDTLFAGGPGATQGRDYSDFRTIIQSIRTKLLTLPPETLVHTGHGDTTTVGAEAPHFQEWIDRGF